MHKIWSPLRCRASTGWTPFAPPPCRLAEKNPPNSRAGSTAACRTRISPPRRSSSGLLPPISLLGFARRRLPGVAKVRILNPSLADHGFESRHTIVQIVNDDMPFLVDSIANEFNRREIAVHLLAHPVMAARRDLDGDLVGIALEAGERARPESVMHIEIDRQPDRRRCIDEIADGADAQVLADVRLAVDRLARDAGRVDETLDELVRHRADLVEPAERRTAARIRGFPHAGSEANHFTFLGYRRISAMSTAMASQPRRHAATRAGARDLSLGRSCVVFEVRLRDLGVPAAATCDGALRPQTARAS
jgi:NAD-specific glutamate dehydrogenase